MKRIMITVFGKLESAGEDAEDVIMVQVELGSNWRESDVYDFRYSAPVHEHLLEEVSQLVDDLLRDCVSKLGGLQPTLFA